ncbi:MAG: protease, partial [Candidatus Saccharibacteria bacterium]|nr:protease [Candidatus Saccharibacteria bacterium]
MYKQIAENKRRTIYIIIGFVLMIGAIAGIFAYVYGDWKIAVWTLIVAIAYAVFQYFYAGSLAVMMTGAKEIEKKDNPRFYNIVENLSITTGLP